MGPALQDKGIHLCRLSLTPHLPDWQDCSVLPCPVIHPSLLKKVLLESFGWETAAP